MSLRFCILGSGSSGNCIYVADPGAAVLVDAGLSGKETFRRLEAAGAGGAAIAAICLTHEHGDHITGLAALSSRLHAPVYANSGTIEAVRSTLGERKIEWHAFSTGHAFKIGSLTVEPFSVCHDARDPVGFIFTSGAARLGVVTDIGVATALVREKLRDCAALVIEANHDERMLRESGRPWALKQRIAGRQGHLSNRSAAELLAECAGPGLRMVRLAHLSSECNKPDLAVKEITVALRLKNLHEVEVTASLQGESTEMWCVE